MKKPPSRTAAGLFAVLLLAGCSSLHVVDGEPIPGPSSDFEPGVTSRAQVLERLGPPGRVTAVGDGVAFLYERIVFQESQLGVGLDLLDLPYLKFSMGAGQAQRQTLLLVFDREGRLRVDRFLEWSEDLGSGVSAQVLVAVESVVDTSFLERSWDANDWGVALLDPLPQTLNAQASIDLGQAGFEQRGTPGAVGQRTLELPRQ